MQAEYELNYSLIYEPRTTCRRYRELFTETNIIYSIPFLVLLYYNCCNQ